MKVGDGVGDGVGAREWQVQVAPLLCAGSAKE